MVIAPEAVQTVVRICPNQMRDRYSRAYRRSVHRTLSTRADPAFG